MPHPTVRLRMTLLYAGVFLLAGAALLTVSYILVRNNLTADHVSVGSGPADELRRAIQREVADDALHRLRVQYTIALAAMTGLSVLLGWLVAGRVLRPLQQITSTPSTPAPLATSCSRPPSLRQSLRSVEAPQVIRSCRRNSRSGHTSCA